MKNRIEILAPAGSGESLEAAMTAGADAVYLGGRKFGARAYAENFSDGELLDTIDYVHVHGKKIYLAVNTLIKDRELEELYDYLAPYYLRGLDAVIVQDLGVMEFVREAFPKLPIHVSTQATVTGALGADFFKERGVCRIVPARELSLPEIRKMKQDSGLEIECFVHGALCYCYSGQCLLSSMIGGRSGNRGQCAQPCRLPYAAGDGKAQDIMSLKDLCVIDMLPELIEAGIDSFKIEGRMKQPEYVYTVVSMYRKYTDLYNRSGRDGFAVDGRDRAILWGSYQRRGYTTGYYKQHNGKDMVSFCRPKKSAEEALCVPRHKMQQKINGKLILSEGEHAKLYIGTADTEIEYTGAAVQRAKNRPLDTAHIEKQMRKTGNTEFVFDRFDMEVKGQVFLPVQALNELRREGIAKLEKEILSDYHRDGAVDRKEWKTAGREALHCRQADVRPDLSVLVSETPHFNQVIGDGRIDTVYADASIGFSAVRDKERKGQKLFLALPYIFREGTAHRWENLYDEMVSLFDGVLIRNFESFQWLKGRGYPKEIRSDYNLYVFNRMSRKVMEETGVGRFFAPVELNYKELAELGLENGGLIVYGNQPVMVSANCIRKNTKGCNREDGRLYLTDRFRKKFAVKNYCADCYNVIYNCQPLVLLSQQREVKELHPAELRMDFTGESAKEAERMIELYWKCFKKELPVSVPDIDYTKGHFRRGVK